EIFALDAHQTSAERASRVAVSDRVAQKSAEDAVGAPEVVVEALPQHAEARTLETHRRGIDPPRHALEREVVPPAREAQRVRLADQRLVAVVDHDLRRAGSALRDGRARGGGV